jgi:molybdopterin-containing oxidoreductase family membrane subunit
VRQHPRALYAACAALVVAIEIEKGMGTIVPGFIPEPWGRIVEYAPTWVEWTVSLGILALGCFVFSVLAKAAASIESGRLRAPAAR